MNQTVLVGDNYSPFACDLSVSLRSRGAAVFLLVSPEQGTVIKEENTLKEKDSSDLTKGVLVWNKPSPLSARTISLALKNRCEKEFQAVFVLDGPELIRTILAKEKASSSNVTVVADSASLIDEYIRGLYLLVSEIASVFRQRGAGRFVFILKPLESSSGTLVSALIESAFVRLAEEIAKDFASVGIPALQTMLIKIEDPENEEILAWTIDRILAYGSEKTGTRWIKAGSKGLFGKF